MCFWFPDTRLAVCIVLDNSAVVFSFKDKPKKYELDREIGRKRERERERERDKRREK
jgi:hypothetical protein